MPCHLELFMTIIFIWDNMVFSSSIPCQKWCQSQLSYFIVVQFFKESALERRYIDRYSPNQCHPSITTLKTCLAGMFQRTRV